MANGHSTNLVAREDRTIQRAVKIIEQRFLAQHGPKIDGPAAARRYAALKLARYKREVFLAIWLDALGRVLGIEEVSLGTITEVVIHPRELVRSAIKFNACRLVVAHNHPSGQLEFSDTDRKMTENLRAAMKLIDVRLDDHLLVANGVCSLIEVEAREQLKREEDERCERELRAAELSLKRAASS